MKDEIFLKIVYWCINVIFRISKNKKFSKFKIKREFNLTLKIYFRQIFTSISCFIWTSLSYWIFGRRDFSIFKVQLSASLFVPSSESLAKFSYILVININYKFFEIFLDSPVVSFFHCKKSIFVFKASIRWFKCSPFSELNELIEITRWYF